MGHVKALKKISSKYPIRRVEVKVDTVPQGNTNYDWWLDVWIVTLWTESSLKPRSISTSWLSTWTENRFPANLYNQILATTDTSGVTRGCIPVQERCSRTKEIPFPGNITEKSTPYLGLTWPRHVRSGNVPADKTGKCTSGDSLYRTTSSPHQRGLVCRVWHVIEIDRNRQVLFDYSA